MQATDFAVDDNKSRGRVEQIVHCRIDLNPIAASMATGGLLGALILGGGSRLAMRFVAIITGMAPSFTTMGTLAILFGGAVAGVILGLVYLPVQRWVPFRWPIKAALFGVVLAALIVLPLFGDPEGEAALVAPWIGATLFGALPLLFSFALAARLERADRRLANAAPRTVNVFWLACYLAAALAAFSGLASIVDGARTPLLLQRALEGMGIPFHEFRSAHGGFVLLFMGAFFALHGLAFWLAAQTPALQAVSLAQLLLAALCLRIQPLWPALSSRGPGSVGEWMAWLLLLIIALMGGVALLRLRARPMSAMWTWVLGGVLFFVAGLLLGWLIALTATPLQLRNWTALQTTFTVAPFLLSWLVLPAALIGAARRAPSRSERLTNRKQEWDNSANIAGEQAAVEGA